MTHPSQACKKGIVLALLGMLAGCIAWPDAPTDPVPPEQPYSGLARGMQVSLPDLPADLGMAPPERGARLVLRQRGDWQLDCALVSRERPVAQGELPLSEEDLRDALGPCPDARWVVVLADASLSSSTVAQLVVTLGDLGQTPLLAGRVGPAPPPPAVGPIHVVTAARLFSAPELGQETYGAALVGRPASQAASPGEESTSAME